MSQVILDKLRSAIQREGLDGAVIVSPENVTWCSGVAVPSQKIVRHRHAIVLVPAQDAPEMLVVDIEEGLVRSRSSVAEIFAYNEFTTPPIDLLAERIEARGLASARLGLEVTYLNHRDYQKLSERLPKADLVSIDGLLEKLRMVKTPEEIEKLTRSARLAEEVGYRSLQTWVPGMTEADLGQTITEVFNSLGGDQLTMLSVTAGERTPMLNGGPTGREIRAGEVVRIDVIGTVDNYVCDVARTAVVGEPEPRLKEIWQKLVDCRDRALGQIRAGESSQQIYRDYIGRMDEWSLPTLNFLGHGLGLTLHEEPYLNRYADCILEPGMVLAVEPLVCFPELGMQLEEAVVVTEKGCRLLTDQYPTDPLWIMQEGERL